MPPAGRRPWGNGLSVNEGDAMEFANFVHNSTTWVSEEWRRSGSSSEMTDLTVLNIGASLLAPMTMTMTIRR